MTKLRRLPWVLDTTGDSRSGLYAKMSRDEFPRPVPIGARSVAWREDAVLAWVEKRIADAVDQGLVEVYQAAEEAGIPSEDLEPFVESGELPTITIGKNVMIRRAVMADFQRKYATTLKGLAA